MTERYCRKLNLGQGCYGCPTLEILKSERMANPYVESARLIQWVGQSECPTGELPEPSSSLRKISSDRWVRR